MAVSSPTLTEGRPRDLMLVAREAVRRLLESQGDVLAVYLAGSVARGDATDTSDVDLGIIVERCGGSHMIKPPMLLRGVPVSCRLIPSPRLLDVRRLWLEDLILSSQLLESVALYDPEGVLRRLKQRLVDLAENERLAKKRIKLCLEFAEQKRTEALEYLGRRGCKEGAAASLLNAILYGLGPAVLIKAGVPLSQRSFLLRLEEACEVLDEPRLYARSLEILGLEGASARRALGAPSVLEALHRTTYDALSRFYEPFLRKGSPWLNLTMLEYVKGGAEELSARGKYAAAVFCCMVLGTRYLGLVEETAPRLPSKTRLEALRCFRRLFGLDGVDVEGMGERTLQLGGALRSFSALL